MWVEVCAGTERTRNVDIVYLASQLKSNAKLKGMVIKLGIQKILNLKKYQMYSAVEGVYKALIDILNIVIAKYINNSNVKTREHVDQDAEMFLQSELQKYAAQTLHEETVLVYPPDSGNCVD